MAALCLERQGKNTEARREFERLALRYKDGVVGIEAKRAIEHHVWLARLPRVARESESQETSQ